MKNLRNWGEAFYTEDYDQEMLDFIEVSYPINTLWNLDDIFLNYAPAVGCFWTDNYKPDHWGSMGKEEFKRKIGMIGEEEKIVDKNAFSSTFSKSDLVDGMFVKFADGEYRLVLAGNLHRSEGFCPLDSFTEDLLFGHGEGDDTDIVEVLTCDSSYTLKTNLELGYGLKSIWKRPPEKTQSQLKLESLQQKMESLQEEMNILQKSIEAGE